MMALNDTDTAMFSASELACGRRGQLLAEAVAFRLAPGEALQVEGPNGSGKTTLLRTLAGLAPALRGSVAWRGRDIRRCVDSFRMALVYIGHDNGIEPELTAIENLRVLITLGGEHACEHELHYALENVGLEEEWERPARTLSRGQRRRVALARLWCTHKPLWLLDEPLEALDRQAAAHLKARVAAHLYGGGLAVFVTHQPMLRTLNPSRLLLAPD